MRVREKEKESRKGKVREILTRTAVGFGRRRGLSTGTEACTPSSRSAVCDFKQRPLEVYPLSYEPVFLTAFIKNKKKLTTHSISQNKMVEQAFRNIQAKIAMNCVNLDKTVGVKSIVIWVMLILENHAEIS